MKRGSTHPQQTPTHVTGSWHNAGNNPLIDRTTQQGIAKTKRKMECKKQLLNSVQEDP